MIARSFVDFVAYRTMITQHLFSQPRIRSTIQRRTGCRFQPLAFGFSSPIQRMYGVYIPDLAAP